MVFVQAACCLLTLKSESVSNRRGIFLQKSEVIRKGVQGRRSRKSKEQARTAFRTIAEVSDTTKDKDKLWCPEDDEGKRGQDRILEEINEADDIPLSEKGDDFLLTVSKRRRRNQTSSPQAFTLANGGMQSVQRQQM